MSEVSDIMNFGRGEIDPVSESFTAPLFFGEQSHRSCDRVAAVRLEVTR